MPGEIVPIGETSFRTQAEVLTEQFYRWETKGRGWQLWSYPVELEPVFQPFLYHSIPPPPSIDDARRVSFMTSFFDGIRGFFGSSSRADRLPVLLSETSWEELVPEVFSDDSKSAELQISPLSDDPLLLQVVDAEGKRIGEKIRIANAVGPGQSTAIDPHGYFVVYISDKRGFHPELVFQALDATGHPSGNPRKLAEHVEAGVDILKE